MCSLGPQFLRDFGRWKRWLVVAAAFLFFGVSSVSCGGGSQEDYVAANEEILAGLPVPDGAEEKSRSSNQYSLSEMSGPDGYTTNVVYTVPEGTTGDEVLLFYEEALGEEWEHCQSEAVVQEPGVLGGPTPPPPVSRVVTETFHRDGALVSVLLDGLFPETYAATIEVAVDHNAFRNFCASQFIR